MFYLVLGSDSADERLYVCVQELLHHGQHVLRRLSGRQDRQLCRGLR